jgi:YcaO-like protein with predicted kinase domain
MKLNKSPKIFENYKSDLPENTIKRIENGLKKIGLTWKYQPRSIKTEVFESFSGELLLDSLGFSTHGKGSTPLLAKASTFAEMAERFSAGFLYCRTVNCEKNMKKYNQILSDVTRRMFLLGFEEDDNLYTNKEVITKYFQDEISDEKYELIKENKLLEYVVDAYSIINKKNVKVPIHFIENIAGSTGLASGNTIEEAIIEASCEIFERYITSLIVSNNIECPTINIKTIQNEKIKECIEMLESMDIDIKIKDFSMNNNFPVIGILFINNNLKENKNLLTKDLYYKSIHPGSHLDFEKAIFRCFNEYFQKSYAYNTEELKFRKKHDLLYDLWTKHLNKKYVKNKEKFKYFTRYYIYFGDLSFLEKGKEISFATLKNLDSNDFYDDIYTVAEICKKNQWDFQIINCTQKALNFPTVRVLIPPISTDFDPFVLKLLDLKDYKERFNTFHGIKGLYDFLNNDDWINDKEKIKIFIKNIEEYLSNDLSSFDFSLGFGVFNIYINLFHVLAFSNLAIENYDEALKYFEVLVKLNYTPYFFNSYFNELFNKGYNPSVYSVYINLLKEVKQINSKLPSFVFTKNPLKSTFDIDEDVDYFYTLLFNSIRESYNV